MKIGIDFGTSYSAAGAVVDGKIELIRFGDQEQFRTTVFFPLSLPSAADFELTPALEVEVARLVADSTREQNAAAVRASAARQRAMAEPADRREEALAMVPGVVARSAEALRRDAVNAVRRRWSSEQARRAADSEVDLQNALYGDEAIDAYVASGSGHLVVSPKSMLGFRLHGSARKALLGIATHILGHIRSTASRQLGTEVRSVVLGRPVEFRSSMGEAGGLQAVGILTDAAHAAGFESVEFLEEPAAAAMGHHQGEPERRRTLVVDIGGGTTDVAIADIGGAATRPAILRSWGLAQGGTDVDIELSMRRFMPLFGKGCTRTPVHQFYEAAAVHDLQRQASFRRTAFHHVEAPFDSRLAQLQAFGNTIRLSGAVERAKIRLSEHRDACVPLDYIEPGLEAQVDRAGLDEGASRFLSSLRGLLVAVAGDLERTPETVYLTGGMSRAPYVRGLVTELFPGAGAVLGNASLGVVSGLAVAASTDLSAA
ncbi:MAG: Hsp70 family protein [Pseudomonadota bacterium]|nr:Hsp70 family protein [Pseudomonadota bacterium]